MKKVFVAILSFYLSFAVAQNSDIQSTHYNVITTAVPLLDLVTMAGVNGVGDIGVVATDNNYSAGLVSNPALLSSDKLRFGFLATVKNQTPSMLSVIVPLSRKLQMAYLVNRNTFSLIFDVDSLGIDKHLQLKDSYHSLRAAYAINDKWSLGLGMKYYKSESATVTDNSYYRDLAAHGLCFDLGMNYRNTIFKNNTVDINYGIGASITNFGAKVSYNESPNKDFLPTDLNIGGIVSCQKIFDNDMKLDLSVLYQADKLLVPTNPERDSFGNITAGKDNNRSAFNALFTSFADAPDGAKEEFREIAHHIGTEVALHIKEKISLSLKAGAFFENKYKGDRHYQTVGLGAEVYGFKVDLSHVFSPTNFLLNNTNHLTVGYVMNI
ncbi:MAG: PorV/PorQ family protein [Bacteroidales bacterium]|nr:PorV/PorQ family protein [Bacteroidales bacterium]